MIYKELMQIYNMNPLKCYTNVLLNRDVKLKNMCSYVMIVLYAIDEVIRENKNVSYYYYIKDIKSMLFLLTSIKIQEFNYDIFEESIFILDFSKLIYKFTCAKKFYECDDSICQLRINSWGRELINSENLLKKYKIEYEQIKNIFAKYYEEHRKEYDLLTSLLLEEINTNSIEKIKNLNNHIKVMLLS